MMKKIILSTLTLTCLSTVIAAHAFEPRPYAGLQLGYAETGIKQHTNNQINNDGFAGQFNLGYQFTPTVGAELGYTQFASKTVAGKNGDSTFRQNAADLNIKGRSPIGINLDVFAKGGVTYLKTATSEPINGIGPAGASTMHEWMPNFGAGLTLHANQQVALDLSYNRIQHVGGKPLPSINFMAVGLNYQFA